MNYVILKEDVDRFAKTFSKREEIRGKSFMITGATGLLGSLTVKCLLALNEDISVICQVRNKQKAEKVFDGLLDRITLYSYPLSSLTNFETHVDYIIHFAAPTASRFFVDNPVETIDAVVSGTMNVLQYAKKVGVKSFVYASSLEVYGVVNDDSKAITEDEQGYINPLDERSSYPMGKRMAECLCYSYYCQHNVPAKIARLAQTFGPGIEYNDGRVFAYLSRSIVENKDIVLNSTGELSRTYCYTIDAISAILYILLLGENGKSYNVGNDNTYISVAEMARFLQKEFLPSINVKIEPRENMGFSPVTKLRLDTNSIKQLGWKPHFELKEMFSRLINYLR